MKFIFILIIFIACALRFYQLGINPPSLDWDEASMGYNAYSLLKTGADEYGNKLPLSIRSFDVYQLPIYVYSTIPSIAVFGLNEFATRLPAAIYGFITVILTYFLVKEIFLINGEKKIEESYPHISKLKRVELIALLSTFFMAISPWHLQFSRAAFEAICGLLFFVSGTLFFLKSIKHPNYLILSSVSFGLTLYSYHSFRFLTPLFIFCIGLLFWKNFIKKKCLWVSILILIIFNLPIIYNLTINKKAEARLSMVSIFMQDELKTSIRRLEYDRSHGNILGQIFENRRVVYTIAVVKGYFDHWNPDFLFIHGDGGKQHHAVDAGMIYLWEVPFIIFGMIALSKRINKRVIVFIIWILIAPLASALTTGTPHPVRAIIMIPPLHILTALGVVECLGFVFNNNYFIIRTPIKYFLLSVLTLLLLFNISYYLHQYYVHTPIEYGYFWQYGYKDLFLFLKKHETTNNKIIVTYKYDQPYIYYLFYNRINPSWYQKNWDYLKNGNVERMSRTIGNYEFRNIDWAKDQQLHNTLIAGTPDEIPSKTPTIIKEILYLDGSIAFRVAKL